MSTSPDATQTRERTADTRHRSEGEERAAQIRQQAERLRESRQQADTAETQSPRGAAESHRRAESVQQRVDAARAQRVLSSVNDRGWWNQASVHDLERAQAVANAPGTPAASRASINARMEQVAQSRYGTNLSGAIRYEAQNPTQPPPDMRAPGSARSL